MVGGGVVRGPRSGAEGSRVWRSPAFGVRAPIGGPRRVQPSDLFVSPDHGATSR